jgi:tagaturonate epimerase
MQPNQSISSLAELKIFPRSLVRQDGVEYALVQTDCGSKLAVLGKPATIEGFEGECSELGGKSLLIGECKPQNATALRRRLTWLRPGLIGLSTSAGMGDRVGLATPGHVRAVRAVGGKIAPIFAQQSIREMARTGRTPQQVMDDAMWGIFGEGWQNGFGADADHLKTPADIDACLAAGYTFFTIDPGDHVDNRAESASPGELRELAGTLPDDIRSHLNDLL